MTILMSSNAAKAANLLKATKEYLDSLGIGILAPKCAAFSIIITRDSWYLVDFKLKTENGHAIPPALADTTLR
jgi:hypothetical protein